jgi:putative transposase
MNLLVAHKIALDPNAEQHNCFARAAGTARFAYNWALNEWKRQYKEGDKPSEAALRRLLNEIKYEQFPWMLEVSKTAPQQAIKNLGTAFYNFFHDLKKPKHERHFRYPTFKKKGEHDSFRADNGAGTVLFDDKRIRLPVIGWIRMREGLRFVGKIISVTISRVADRWFASVCVEIEHQPPIRENQATSVVGVDLGISALATISDGRKIAGPKALRRSLKKLRRLSRAVSRKKKGSANRRKAVGKLARLHARVANIRRDTLHKLTTNLCKRYTAIGIEDLHVKGMLRNGKLARSIADCGWGEFRRQADYKAPMWNSAIHVAGRFFPSSKTCHVCGCVHAEMTLSVRAWTCAGCGTVHDRDDNASQNLKKFAASSAVTACGAVRSSGRRRMSAVKLPAMKQEPASGHV